MIGFAGDVRFLGGQLRLIDEAHAPVSPFESLDHKSWVIESSGERIPGWMLNREGQVLLLHLSRRKHGHKRRRSSGFLHVPTTPRLFAFYQAQDSDHIKAEFTGGLNCLNGGTACRAVIVDDVCTTGGSTIQ